LKRHGVRDNSGGHPWPQFIASSPGGDEPLRAILVATDKLSPYCEIAFAVE
jgi:hypothetical protein